ncbi:hypothetical protein COOONC_06060 [Cooperia oncophora]
MQICRVCGAHRKEGEFYRSRCKETLLIMLCAMLEKEEIEMSDAQDLYNESVRLGKRICRSHFKEAVPYISNVVDMACKTVVKDLSTLSSDAIKEVVAHIESCCQAIDPSFTLTATHLISYYRCFGGGGVSPPLASRKRKEPAHSPTSQGSRQKTVQDALMQLMVPSHSTSSLQDILKFDGTDPKLLDQEFRIKGSQLLKLFRFCPSCGSKISDSTGCVSLRAAGMTPIVHYICTACSPFEKCFQGQEEAHSSEMSLGSNLEAVMTAIETELSSANSQRLDEKVTADRALHDSSIGEVIDSSQEKRCKKETNSDSSLLQSTSDNKDGLDCSDVNDNAVCNPSQNVTL